MPVNTSEMTAMQYENDLHAGFPYGIQRPKGDAAADEFMLLILTRHQGNGVMTVTLLAMHCTKTLEILDGCAQNCNAAKKWAA